MLGFREPLYLSFSVYKENNSRGPMFPFRSVPDNLTHKWDSYLVEDVFITVRTVHLILDLVHLNSASVTKPSFKIFSSPHSLLCGD
jgi:hypothetical protein